MRHLTLDSNALVVGELEASQQLAILVAVVDAIYPAPPARLSPCPAGVELYAVEQHWRHLRPSALLRFLATWAPDRCRSFVIERGPEFFDHMVDHRSSASGILTLWQFTKLHRLNSSDFVSALVARFAAVLGSLRRAGSGALARLVNVFRSLGLREHAQLLAVMIPLDDKALFALIRNISPHKAARRVHAVATANPALFREFASHFKQDAELSRVIWEDWDGTDPSFVANRFVLIWKFPARLRKRAIQAAPSEAIRQWAANGTVRHSLAVLFMRLGRPEDSSLTRSDIERLAVARIRTLPARQLRGLPWVIGMHFRRRDQVGTAVADAILTRIDLG